MLVKDCIQLAATLLQHNLSDSEIFTTDTINDYMLEDKELQLFIKSANMVQSQLADEYFPLTDTVTLTTQGFVIPYKAFTKAITQALTVSAGGRKLPFSATMAGITVPQEDSEVTIKYNYRPNCKKFTEELEVGAPRIDIRVVAFGIAAEYSFVKNNYEDATIWDNRFKSALLSINAKKSEIQIKKRGWY